MYNSGDIKKQRNISWMSAVLQVGHMSRSTGPTKYLVDLYMFCPKQLAYILIGVKLFSLFIGYGISLCSWKQQNNLDHCIVVQVHTDDESAI
jgi:hypothetical protein